MLLGTQMARRGSVAEFDLQTRLSNNSFRVVQTHKLGAQRAQVAGTELEQQTSGAGNPEDLLGDLFDLPPI